MNKTDYVSLETAKLLKEVGFDEPTYHCYDYTKNLTQFDLDSSTKIKYNSCKHLEEMCHYFGVNEDYCPNNRKCPCEHYPELISAPHLYDAQKWLREVHKIHIEILYDYEYDSTPYHYCIRKIDNPDDVIDWIFDFKTYEEALDSAIKNVVK